MKFKMGKMKKCKTCGTDIAKSAKVCPSCGAKQQHIWSKWWVWLIAIIVVAFIAGSSGEQAEPGQPDGTAEPVQSSQQASSEETESEEEISVWNSSGMYKVGTDIEAGEYLVQAAGSCYFEVSADSSGSLSSIVSNDNFTSWRYITVIDGQYLTVRKGNFARVEDIDPITSDTGTYAAGMYKVGRDIPAGEYKISATGRCYIEVTSDSTGTLLSIVTNDNITPGESMYITVSDGQYVKFDYGTMTVG